MQLAGQLHGTGSSFVAPPSALCVGTLHCLLNPCRRVPRRDNWQQLSKAVGEENCQLARKRTATEHRFGRSPPVCVAARLCVAGGSLRAGQRAEEPLHTVHNGPPLAGIKLASNSPQAGL